MGMSPNETPDSLSCISQTLLGWQSFLILDTGVTSVLMRTTLFFSLYEEIECVCSWEGAVTESVYL